LKYGPPTIVGTLLLFEEAPFMSLPVVDGGAGEEDGRERVGDVESLPDEEVDDRFKVTGTFPRASGSLPTF
jgi:hypothetical protein